MTRDASITPEIPAARPMKSEEAKAEEWGSSRWPVAVSRGIVEANSPAASASTIKFHHSFCRSLENIYRFPRAIYPSNLNKSITL